MDVQFVCPEGADLTLLHKAYPDLCHDDTYDGDETWFIGRSSDEYFDGGKGCYNYGSDDEPDYCDECDDEKEWMTRDEAVEFCGFAETLIGDSETMLEGNGGWAQGELRKSKEYKKGAERARELVKSLATEGSEG